MTSTIELRPDRRLLDHEFEGYKLNLQALPHYSHELAIRVDRVFPDEIQYSFIHAKLFALHNHLVPDPWDYTHSYYYIDRRQQVRHLTFESTTHSFQNTAVYDVPAHVARKSGHFNLCLSFPSDSMAVISDGTGYLHIVNTFARNRPASHNQTWETLHSSLILGEEKYFLVIDSRLQEKNGSEILHCLLQSVEQNDSHFISSLTWVSFECDDDKSWRQTSYRQVQGKGVVHYAAIETSCSALLIASDYPFKFTADSESEITEKKEEPRKVLYTWLQTSEDITITLQLQENFDKNLVNINVSPFEVKISYAGNYFVSGKLFNRVDSELTTWNIQDNGLVNILLTKSDSMLWQELIEGGDKNGDQIMDEGLMEEAHKRLAHLCSETEVTDADASVPGLSTQELEECDAASTEDTVLVRLDTNHNTTHRVPLSVHQYLFSLRLEAQEAPAIALRHDVDTCLWQPYSRLNTDAPLLLHQGTLMAFGYVQSSKQNKKFLTCPPNFSYGVVSESSRHIFIYQNRHNPDSQLRKRSGGTVRNIKVGQQHVFNVEKYGEVVGIDATNDHLFILTETNILAIGIQ